MREFVQVVLWTMILVLLFCPSFEALTASQFRNKRGLFGVLLALTIAIVGCARVPHAVYASGALGLIGAIGMGMILGGLVVHRILVWSADRETEAKWYRVPRSARAVGKEDVRV